MVRMTVGDVHVVQRTPLRAIAGRLSRDVKFEAFYARAAVLEALDTIALDGELADVTPPLRFAVLPNALCTIVPEVT